jgi:hypothetical protein
MIDANRPLSHEALDEAVEQLVADAIHQCSAQLDADPDLTPTARAHHLAKVSAFARRKTRELLQRQVLVLAKPDATQ